MKQWLYVTIAVFSLVLFGSVTCGAVCAFNEDIACTVHEVYDSDGLVS